MVAAYAMVSRFIEETDVLQAIRMTRNMRSGSENFDDPPKGGYYQDKKFKHNQQTHFVQNTPISHRLVNLRKRIAPTLSDFSLGNLIWIASAKCKATCEQLRLDGLVNEVRRGIHKINGDFVKKMRGDNGPAVMSKSLQEIGNFGSKTGVDYYGFTSWCKMGFYEADFGWGKPVWASSVGLNSEVFMNLIILMDTKCGEGIEA
ncbi:limonoid 7-O-acetyltransferse-like [Apium graveolens]|uniref:limonoid 7-O-acetyltransferse-like n=1 Tax=Apium graveolens TaxID=4045 RepID=UPI003D7A4EEC